MRRPCVRVPRDEGEETRRLLDEADLRDGRYEIQSDDEFVYIPVLDAPAVADTYNVVEREVDPRDTLTMPEDLLAFTPTYERLGELILLQEENPDRARQAAKAFMTCDLPVSTVLNRASAVSGTRRVPDWEVLAGSETETVHREYGAEFLVDPTRAYFSPRLATERQRVISQIAPDEHVFDMFAGVGPYAIRAALAGATVVAVDINPEAIEYLRENTRRNEVADEMTIIEGDVDEVVDSYSGWADRVIMNLPHSAQEHLGAARTVAGDRCVLHYYDIQSEPTPFEAGEQAIAEVFETTHAVSFLDRRVVRSYAPGEVNVCLDVQLTAHQ